MKKLAAAYAIESLGLSERRACLLTGISPSVYWYKPKQGDDDVLRRRMRELAGERKRFGSPRLHIMLKREGLVINHKRTERISSEEGLALRKKRRRKGAARARETVPSPVRPNQRWSMDFVSDSTVIGRRFRALAIVDDYVVNQQKWDTLRPEKIIVMRSVGRAPCGSCYSVFSVRSSGPAPPSSVVGSAPFSR